MILQNKRLHLVPSRPCLCFLHHRIYSILCRYTAYLQFFQLFMLFWVMNFIVALGQVTLAGAFASYYWAFNKPDDVPVFPVSSSLWRALRYIFLRERFHNDIKSVENTGKLDFAIIYILFKVYVIVYDTIELFKK